MERTTTILEGLLEKCTTMAECFEVQNALADGLSAEEELKLRAKYAGLTVEEAKTYQDALRTLRAIENKHMACRIKEVQESILNVIC